MSITDKKGLLRVSQNNPARPTVCLKDYCKWYNIHVLYPSGSVEDLTFDVLDIPGAPATQYLDHTPNPLALCHWAACNNYHIDSISLAAVTRRWYNEYLDKEEMLEHTEVNET